MTKFERRILDFICENRYYILLLTISILGLFERFFGLDFESWDYKKFLEPWFEEIKSGGAASLGNNVGNYGLTYQLLIFLMTLLPFKPLISYKALSVVFDYLLAFSAGKLACAVKGERSLPLFSIVYSVVLANPTVVFNSSLWAQCDSIYSFFSVMALVCLLEKKDIRAFVLLGIGFAFKLQTIFFLPLFLYVYFSEKRFSVLYFGISVASMYAMCLPAFFLGHGLLEPITIYVGQASTNYRISLNIPNFVSFFSTGLWYYVFMTALLIAVLVLGGGLLTVIRRAGALSGGKAFILAAAWSVWSVVMFLPRMHERYTFPAEILLIVLAALDRKYIFFALLSCVTSMLTYSHYLFNTADLEIWYSVLYVFSWLVFTLLVYKDFSRAAPIAARSRSGIDNSISSVRADKDLKNEKDS